MASNAIWLAQKVKRQMQVVRALDQERQRMVQQGYKFIGQGKRAGTHNNRRRAMASLRNHRAVYERTRQVLARETAVLRQLAQQLRGMRRA